MFIFAENRWKSKAGEKNEGREKSESRAGRALLSRGEKEEKIWLTIAPVLIIPSAEARGAREKILFGFLGGRYFFWLCEKDLQ